MAGALELLIYGSIASLAVILLGESLLLQNPADVAPEMMKLLRLDGLLTQDTMRIVSSSLITTGVFAFYTIVPITHVLGTKSTSVGTAPWQWKVRHILFQFLSWTFYASCVLLSLVGLYASGWFWRQAAGYVASLGVLGMIAQVFMVSSFYVLESKFVGGQMAIAEKFTAAVQKLKTINPFLSMNILLAVIAAGLAVRAEYSWRTQGNAVSAAVEISLAVGLSIIVLFNTHGLGGRALHQRWAFWQPWVGGAKFVTVQIASWFFFGISIVLEVLFIVSTFVVGLEIFVGITAIAGVLCVFSELLLVGSLFLFRPDVQVVEVTTTYDESVITTTTISASPDQAATTATATTTETETHAATAGQTADEREQAATQAVPGTAAAAVRAPKETVVVEKSTVHLEKTMRTELREPSKFEQLYTDAHRTLLILFIVNVQFVPFILLLVPFCLCGLKWADASGHWFAACLSIAAYTLAYAYIKAQIIARARKIADREATQEKMWKTWYTAVLGVCLLIPTCGAIAALVNRSPAFPVWASISVCHFVYVWGTYKGTPEISGCRTMKYQGEWHPMLVRMGEELRCYFKGRVIRTAALDPNGLYVFGFHPHGIMPVTVLWLKLSNQWRKLFPGVDFSVLTASVIHLVPFMRDITQVLGGREVSRESFRSALVNRTNVLLVPGGQAEMLKSSSYKPELQLVTRHAGFIKQAVEKGAALVPILSLGEVDMMDNVDMPTVQNWFLQRVGISVPFLPYGSFYLPIPRPVPITIVVGEPIATKQEENPSEQVIKELKVAYYKQIRAMFEKYKHEAGHAHRQLVFIDADDDMKNL